MNVIDESCKKYRSARHPHELFVAPNGSMKWSGALPAPNAAQSDGPLPSIACARDRLRRHDTPGPVTVWIRGGRYFLDEPIRFTAADSGPFTYAAYPDEPVILDGGRPISGWQEQIVNGRRVWTASVAGGWYFTQLFVNGRRATRPRLPKTGYFEMESVPDTPREGFMAGPPTDTFFSAPGHIQPWQNLTDIDVVAFHYWNEERLPIVSFDPATRQVRCARKSVWPLKADAEPRYARYWVENVKEALTEPGEWYLDRPTGVLTYLPMPGDQLATSEVFAASIPQFLLIQGDADGSRSVAGLTFRGLRFEHSAWHLPGDRAGCEQAAYNVPAVITLEQARHITIEKCAITHVGFYGIELGHGCRGNRIAANTITDLGAGGVKIIGGGEDVPDAARTGGNVVADNEIAEAGQVFASAVGVLIIHSAGNDIVHNHIHHLEYSGISCGWVWGYGSNPTRDNLIAHNHIHHVGSGKLNDLGGIYTLGIQPGTIIRGNRIHDIRMHSYGAWAIYADEGSSYLLIEGNVCSQTDSEVFQLHYGRENIVRNNVFAFSKLGLVSLTAAGAENSLTLSRNILLTRGEPVFVGRDNETLERCGFTSDLNLLWDITGAAVYGADQQRDAAGVARIRQRYTVAELHRLGYDRHSQFADPQCQDPLAGDFRLSTGSPAFALGFAPLDLTAVGPR